MAAPLSKDHWNEPVTQHLRRDYALLRADQTVGEALDWLRDHPPGGRIIYLYVVDGDNRLQGVVPTRRLIMSPADKPVTEIMVRRIVSLPSDASVLEACEFFIQHRLLAFPVIDADHRLLGVVDVELYTGELSHLTEARTRDDLFQTIGVRAAEGVQESPWIGFRRRFPWLGCNLAAGILAALLAGVFEDELNRVVALAFFIPVVLNLAESVSSQSVSLTLQWLHGEQPTWRSIGRKVPVELATGLFLGAGSGLIMALVALVWLGKVWVALCLLGGITGGVAGAAVLGVAVPTLLHLLRLEPRIAAGPVVLAGADVITILLYLNLAHWLL
jgi:magnesium transporter